MKKIVLLCFSQSGSSAIRYYKWDNFFDDSVEVIPVELPGRGERLNEKLLCSLKDLVDDTFKKLNDKNFFNENITYALYGHSLGAMIIYELYHLLVEKNKKLPIHIFMSGKYPFHLVNYDYYNFLRRLTDSEFISELKKIGSLDNKFELTKDFCDMFIPIIRSDLLLVENYKHSQKNDKVLCNVSVLYGEKDYAFEIKKCGKEEIGKMMCEWKQYIKEPFSLYGFDGGHFFVDQFEKEIVDVIKRNLSSYFTS